MYAIYEKKDKKHSENADTSTSVTMNEGKNNVLSIKYMSIHKFYVDDSSLNKSLYTCIILNPSDSRYQTKSIQSKKKILVTPLHPHHGRKRFSSSQIISFSLI